VAVDGGEVVFGAARTSDDVSGRSALETAYVEHYGSLARYATRLVGAALAADLVQEAFVKFASRWRRVRNPRAYLFKVVTRLAGREWKRRRREQEIVADLGQDPDPAGAVAIRLAVLSLPPKERQVIWLHHFADLTVADVAQVLGRPEGTVKSLLYDGRRRLARLLEEDRDGRA
jgi:RNA polymerase sigma-70 factor (ECF subfamily)